jgi:uncharacterized protein YceK
MRSRATICLLAGLVVALNGCATAWNLKEEGQVYGGMRREIVAVPYLIGGSSGTKSDNGFSQVLAMCALLDLPFTAVADTLTLPYTIPTSLLNQRDKREPGAGSGEQTAKPFSSP